MNDPNGTIAHGAKAPPCIMVIFGASGDLTKRLLMPAIYNLSRSGLLSDNFALVGVDRRDQSTEEFRDYLAEGVRSFVSDTAMGGTATPFDEKAWRAVGDRMFHLSGDLNNPETYRELDKLLGAVAAEHHTGGNVLFYLAVAASLFGPIVDQLGGAGLVREQNGAWRRVIIEKPFGNDLASAKALNARVLKVLDESQVYRMDHFLGKETVQSIMAVRFANGMFEPIWNREHIDHVQITVAETIGVEHRGRFYEQTGALRDMVPNHLFQLLTMTAMEPPSSFDPDTIRSRKTDVLNAIPAIAPACAVRGQYGRGQILGRPVDDYRHEPDVSATSAIETYVALKLDIDTWRWAGVPFYLRTGKRMSKYWTEIAIRFRRAPLSIFKGTDVAEMGWNWLVLQIQPEEGISLQFQVKRPGPIVTLAPVKTSFSYKDWFPPQPNVGYETLIYDCMIGDTTLFQRADMVEGGWRIVQPALDDWARQAPTDFPNYEAGTAGPKAADDLLARDGRAWRPIGSSL